MIKSALVLFVVFNSIFSFGQYDFQNVLPNYSGNELKSKLVEKYKPSTVLDYSHARDILYGKIYKENGTVYGVYTRFGVDLPNGVDPSTYLFNNGINAEHTFPRSKGAADGNAKSDMHHLYPSKINVNSDRGSLPFNDINDNQTNDWYYNNIILHSKPQNEIDKYSEHINTFFEPREDHKGNVARAMMYFYTMYKDKADAKDPNFFKNQKETLCKWHFADPVDSLEWIRTWKIAKYQSNKPNPFVLDCSLASRTYCDMLSDACKLVSTHDLITAEDLFVKLYPNPSEGDIKLSFINPGLKSIEVRIIDILGRVVFKNSYKLNGNELVGIHFDIKNIGKGYYILKAKGVVDEKVVEINKSLILE